MDAGGSKMGDCLVQGISSGARGVDLMQSQVLELGNHKWPDAHEWGSQAGVKHCVLCRNQSGREERQA